MTCSKGLMCSALFLLGNYTMKNGQLDQSIGNIARLKSHIERNFFSASLDNTICPFHIDMIEQNRACNSDYEKLNLLYSIQDMNISSLYGPHNNFNLKELNSGIYYLKNKKPGNAVIKLRRALIGNLEYENLCKKSKLNANSRHLQMLGEISLTALFYFAQSLYECKNYSDSFLIYKSFLAKISHPLLYMRMTECCIGLIFQDNDSFYGDKLKKDIMKQVIESDGSLYFTFHNPVEANFYTKDIPPFMSLLSCIQYLNVANELCKLMLKEKDDSTSAIFYPQFLYIKNIKKFMIDLNLKLAFCYLKIDSFQRVITICDELIANADLTAAERYKCGLYKSEAVCLSSLASNDPIQNQVLDEQFNETYTLGLQEDPKNNCEHSRNRILRELSQFNSSVFSFLNGQIMDAKSTMDTQRLNVDYSTNPLNSMYGIINDICISQKGYKTNKLNNILFTNFKFAMSQGI
ncbi:MAG: hypothetical protein MHMPM18_003481 [Marteilia pararefringens]